MQNITEGYYYVTCLKKDAIAWVTNRGNGLEISVFGKWFPLNSPKITFHCRAPEKEQAMAISNQVFNHPTNEEKIDEAPAESNKSQEPTVADNNDPKE